MDRTITLTDEQELTLTRYKEDVDEPLTELEVLQRLIDSMFKKASSSFFRIDKDSLTDEEVKTILDARGKVIE